MQEDKMPREDLDMPYEAPKEVKIIAEAAPRAPKKEAYAGLGGLLACVARGGDVCGGGVPAIYIICYVHVVGCGV